MKKFLCFYFSLIISLNLFSHSCIADTVPYHSNQSSYIELYKTKCLDSINTIRAYYSLPEFSIDKELSTSAQIYLNNFKTYENDLCPSQSSSDINYCIYKQRFTNQYSINTTMLTQALIEDYKGYLLNPNISKIGFYVITDNQTITCTLAFKYN
ncbi:CAP domain-containing protein [Clostridium folliculivorans]|uniref:SCP domain-containing protein n=1 Tax=Clostridium folliculivorans TaxID=2886038 RepID=A0A9W5XYP0_9CLOT|nr:CAP domain-containing protein [Clostridium folliculivorans]GKU23365.1 hypothetical protein CFOLD11_01910 [Clostridium folliculivorans]GKU29482.1 hypothetical protein CFB3_15880 [Clostridium folliculivorans]